MLDIIVYDAIEKKNTIESNTLMVLDSHDSLVHTLNIMDFMIALNNKVERIDDGIDWIVLELK
jgi:hypothetical protein